MITTQPSPFSLTERRTLRSWLSSMMRAFDDGCGAADVTRTDPVAQVSIRGSAELPLAPVAADLREEPRGRRAVEVLTQLHPELVAALDKVAHHELGTALG